MNYIGCGIGLRRPHYSDILNGKSQSDWFEVISENFFTMPGLDRSPLIKKVLKVREQYPIALHGVSLNIGSADQVSDLYLEELKQLIKLIDPCWVSDHMCWTGVSGVNLHDLMPIPYTFEALDHVVSKIHHVQEFIGRSIVLENVSSYFDYKSSEMQEWEFLKEAAQRSGCELLLDVNNIFVSSVNQGFDPNTFLDAIPVEKIRQVHLAGPSDKGAYMIDTHDRPVRENVWQLYEKLIQKAGPLNTLIERDENIPELSELEIEMLRAKHICEASMLSNRRYNELTL